MKIRMIYLAAGNSRRFGSNKLYYEIAYPGESGEMPCPGNTDVSARAPKPLFRYGLDTLIRVLEQCEETTLTVVTEYPEIRTYVQKQQEVRKERISLTGSADHEKGISYSIRAGLEHADADYYLFCVADQPWITAGTILKLIRKTVTGQFAGGYVEWDGISGNPTIFSKMLLPDLLALEGDTGGKRILTGREDVCRVQAQDERELEDVDERNE